MSQRSAKRPPSPRRRRSTRRRSIPRNNFAARGYCARWVSRGSKLLRVLIVCAAVLVSVVLLNFLVQVVRKPSELLFLVSNTLNKAPAETWRSYSAAFRRQSTAMVSAQLLAALAQTEASGNPIARTYWRWSWSLNPLRVYRPASSAVGMYQMTDGTFAEAKRLCVQRHQVRQAGAWNDWDGCWFSSTYMRTLPGDAIELTSAYLDRSIHVILARRHLFDVSPQQTDSLAAVLHLCGAQAADRYAGRGFKFSSGERCGDQDPRQYLARVRRYEVLFSALATES